MLGLSLLNHQLRRRASRFRTHSGASSLRPSLLAVLVIALPGPASAAFWDQPARVGITVGASLVVALGKHPDRARYGFGLDAGYQRFWQDGPYYSNTPYRVAPLATIAAHVGWTKPFAFAEVTAVAGPMYPTLVADGGFIPLVGGQIGIGLGLATDGWAGPIWVGTVVGPWVEARVEASRWKGAWHAPILALGPALEINCCAYLL